MGTNIFEPTVQLTTPYLPYEDMGIQGVWPRPFQIPVDIFPTIGHIAGLNASKTKARAAGVTDDRRLMVDAGSGGNTFPPDVPGVQFFTGTVPGDDWEILAIPGPPYPEYIFQLDHGIVVPEGAETLDPFYQVQIWIGNGDSSPRIHIWAGWISSDPKEGYINIQKMFDPPLRLRDSWPNTDDNLGVYLLCDQWGLNVSSGGRWSA